MCAGDAGDSDAAGAGGQGGDFHLGDCAVGEFGGDDEGTLGAEEVECGAGPGVGYGGEDFDYARVALQEHFHRGPGCGEVAFEGEGAVGEVAVSLAGLVAVGVEAVAQAEGLGEDAEGIGGGGAVSPTGGNGGVPREGVTGPLAGAELLKLGQVGADNLGGLFVIGDADEAEGVDGHEVGEVAVGFGEGLISRHGEHAALAEGQLRHFFQSLGPTVCLFGLAQHACQLCRAEEGGLDEGVVVVRNGGEPCLGLVVVHLRGRTER